MTTILVAGAIANKAGNGGEAWVRLTWALGFRRLGFRVLLLEQIARDQLTFPPDAPRTLEASFQASYFRRVVEAAGLGGCAALLLAGEGDSVGLSRPEVQSIADDASLLVNVSGHLTEEALLRGATRRVYLDLDPGFTQFWHAQGLLGDQLQWYDVHFTVGSNVGRSGCPIPTDGIRWRHTLPPVLLDEWPVTHTQPPGRFTTVARWRSAFGPITWAGTTYGLKVHEFRRFVELPSRVGATFELALAIDPTDDADRRALEDAGWGIVAPEDLCRDPESYRCYLQGSGAEFSAAQGVYVDTGSGWFSDRSACYLASGKPILVQDTDLRGLPRGEGMVTFRTLDEAVEGARRILADPAGHSEAARTLAREHLDSDRVLARFLEQAVTA